MKSTGPNRMWPALLLAGLTLAGCDRRARTQPLHDLAAPPTKTSEAATPAQPDEAKPAAERSRLADEEIRAAVRHAILIDSVVDAPRLKVEVESGIVTLGGEAESLLARDRAVLIAENVRGVRAVVDRLSIDPVVRGDSELAQDVRNALLFDPATDSYEVDVSVADATVTLTGRVDSWPERSLAADVARSVAGIQRVDNRLEVALSSHRSDEDIRKDIEGLLTYDALVDDAAIEVEVQDGAVELSGAVASAGERTRAIRRAYVEGVRSVSADGLDVQYWERERFKRPSADRRQVDDAALEAAVRAALRQDPRVASFKVRVDVHDGVANLDGWVDNLMARRAAERDARNTAGVWSVYNFLRVVPDAEVPDDVLQQRVADALRRDALLGRGRVQALVSNGTVHLVGTADSAEERRRAQDVVASLNGVLHLDSDIVVRQRLGLLDAELEHGIERSLAWDSQLADARLQVSVDDGVATVTGRVDDVHDERRVLKRVYEAGARKVRDRLQVESRLEADPG